MTQAEPRIQEPRRPRILLVDDDPGVRRSLQLLLRGRGFDVRAYAMGSALLADGDVHEAACFISDYRMEDIDGLAVLGRLRADGWNGPAVLITAFPSPDLIERAKAAGYASVVDKPFREHALADIVGRLVAANLGPAINTPSNSAG